MAAKEEFMHGGLTVRLKPGSRMLRLLVIVALAIYAAIPCIASQHSSDNWKPRIGALSITVKTDKSGIIGEYDNVLAVHWSEGHKAYLQSLTLPNDWHVWTAAKPASYLPSEMFWPHIGGRVLVVVGEMPSAAYGVRVPFIYRLRHHVWKQISNPDIVSFTNRGGFYVKNGSLYLWDYEMNANQAHSNPQRYWLKVFTLHRSQLALVKRRLTHRQYLGSTDFESGTPPERLQPNIDPLREFGLKMAVVGLE